MSLTDAADLENRVIDRGRQILAAAQRNAESSPSRWLDRFLERIMEDERFRVQALRFVDVLPALDDDRELSRHLNEYFGEEDFPLTGLVKFGVRHIRAGVASTLVARAVRRVIEGMARRFMGGASAREALASAEALRKRGIGFSFDLLGEAVVSEDEADRYCAIYLKLLAELPKHVAGWPPHPRLDRRNDRKQPLLNVSIKLSSLYSQINHLDPAASSGSITRRLRPILLAARRSGAFVCIDMEQYELKEVTLHCFKDLLLDAELRDWPDVGLAVQAYLRDTERDLGDLVTWARKRGTPVTIRLVRGAYWDYETVVARREGWPVPVWDKKWQTDACYERCLRLLFASHPHVEAAIATHNVRSQAVAMALAEQHGLTPDQFEFQMLYGMAGHLEGVIPDLGYALRAYLPFGELLPGMAYLVRRLLENSSSQSFQRMSVARHLSPAQMLASPHGLDTSPGPASEEARGQAAPGAPFRNEPRRRYTDAAERASFETAIDRVRGGLGRVYPLILHGRPVDTGIYITSVNPARPLEIIGRVAKAEPAHADQAVASALEAFDGWATLPAEKRAEFLLRAAGLLRERRDEFAAFEILEAGKIWPEADANVTEAIDYLDYYGREAVRFAVSRNRHVPGESNAYFYRPRGVGLIVPPWNFPLAILTGMLSAAIAAGNTAILKPSSQTPVIAARFVALLHEVGLPPGVVQFLPGAGAAVGEYLVQHSAVSFIAFTGSEEVGTRIARLAAELRPGQRQVKHLIAEMGGKNAIIVDSDADLDDAVVGVVHSAYGYQGQKCSACSRVIVVGEHYRRFLQRLVEAARSIKVGMPEDPSVFMGPVIEASARQRLLDVIEAGKKSAKLALHRDCAHLGDGYFVGPTIFGDVAPDSMLAQQEIFGPVLSVMRARDIDEAIALANDSVYALTGGIYSRSPANIEKVRRELEVGNLYINRKITGALVERQPFGGFKRSGTGSQAGGPDYLRQFMIPRTITENTLRRGFAPSGSTEFSKPY